MATTGNPSTKRWRLVSQVLGILELITGLALVYSGCRHGWLAGDTMSNVGGTYAMFIALLAFIVPGVLLLGQNPLRWFGQLPLLLIVGWLGLSAVGGLIRIP